MKKRMLSAILAMSMVMGMGTVTAFAEGEETTTNENAFSAENTGFTDANVIVGIPVIDATAITLDPYNIANKGQIYSKEFKFVNNSNVPLAFAIKDAKVVATPDAAVTDDNGFVVATKAMTDGSKWAMVSLNLTDGIGKSTKKVLSKTESTVAATTYMAAYGGVVTFNFTGSCADNITKSGYQDWSQNDKLAVEAVFDFAPVKCTPVTVAKTLVSPVTALTVANDTDEADIAFPATVLGDGKEIPVVWECVNTEGGSAYKADTAGDYTFTAKLADTDVDEDTDGTQSAAASGLYTISESVTMPTITVTVEDAE